MYMCHVCYVFVSCWFDLLPCASNVIKVYDLVHGTVKCLELNQFFVYNGDRETAMIKASHESCLKSGKGNFVHNAWRLRRCEI